MYFLQQNRRTRGRKRFCLGQMEGMGVKGVDQIMYAHISKCKNDTIKFKINK
jgi:hypothetical protein